MTSTQSPSVPKTAPASRAPVRGVLTGCCLLAAFSALALMQAGCSSEPLSSDVAMSLPEVGRAVVGYNDTDYVYPIRVPNTNRYVQMRTKEPLERQPTYEDYLRWKEDN